MVDIQIIYRKPMVVNRVVSKRLEYTKQMVCVIISYNKKGEKMSGKRIGR